jgi:hypothetical protein
LSNAAALSAFLVNARSDGFDVVVIEMKDEIGRLLYQSEVVTGEPPMQVNQIREIVTGTLTAQAIVAAVEEEGMRPVARINTLKDHIAPTRLRDVRFDGWLDGRPDAGGRAWANPFREGTQNYISEIIGELQGAGFAEIILANTIFPKQRFSGTDISILPGYVTDLETRYNGLVQFINAVADNNPDTTILLEVAADCFANLTDDSELMGTAEVLRGDSFAANVRGVVPILARGNFARSGIAEAVPQLLTLIDENSGALTVIPLLDVADLSDEERDWVLSSFAENGFENFILRN